MHFNLPDQLALEVAGYDATRKKLAAAMAAEDRNKNKRQTFPCGRPSNMFPKHIVKDSLWETTVEQLNKEKAPDKFHLFNKLVFGAEPEPIAVVYYHRQLWVAAWLPRSKDDSYLFGLTIAYRDQQQHASYALIHTSQVVAHLVRTCSVSLMKRRCFHASKMAAVIGIAKQSW